MAVESKNAKKAHQGKKSPLKFLEASREQLQRLYARALSGQPKAIHQARVMARRWAAACRLLRDALRKKKASRMAKAVRKLARVLADVRSLDVTWTLAKEMGCAPWLLEALERKRRKRWAQARRVFTVRRLEKLFQKIRKDMNGLQVPQKEWKGYERILHARKKAWQKSYRAAMASQKSIARWHSLRIAGKKWRYALERSQDFGLISSPAPVTALKKLQDALGKAHDEEVLRDFIQKNAAKASPSRQRQAKAWTKKLDKDITASLGAAKKIIARLRTEKSIAS